MDELDYKKLPSKEQVRVVSELLKSLEIDNLLKIGCKNFIILPSKDVVISVKFQIPTNPHKGNRCSIFWDCRTDTYTLVVASEYKDSSKKSLVSNEKIKYENILSKEELKEKFYSIFNK